jgi:hypothetical protein
MIEHKTIQYSFQPPRHLSPTEASECADSWYSQIKNLILEIRRKTFLRKSEGTNNSSSGSSSGHSPVILSPSGGNFEVSHT